MTTETGTQRWSSYHSLNMVTFLDRNSVATHVNHIQLRWSTGGRRMQVSLHKCPRTMLNWYNLSSSAFEFLATSRQRWAILCYKQSTNRHINKVFIKYFKPSIELIVYMCEIFQLALFITSLLDSIEGFFKTLFLALSYFSPFLLESVIFIL